MLTAVLAEAYTESLMSIRENSSMDIYLLLLHDNVCFNLQLRKPQAS